MPSPSPRPCPVCSCLLFGATRIGPDGVERHRSCHVAAADRLDFLPPPAPPAPPSRVTWRPLPGYSGREVAGSGRLRDAATGAEIEPTTAPWTRGYYTLRRDDGAERTLTLAHAARLFTEAGRGTRKGARP
jgi:hypothetical protein